MATKIKNNFLLVERDRNGGNNETIIEHDIVLNDGLTIRINKIHTDNYSAIYNSISDLQLPITALDIRKVQNIVKDIYAGGDIKVNITEDLDTLKNGDKILAIGSSKTISYQFATSRELIASYFKIIDESNYQFLNLIDKILISETQYFPIYGFAKINSNISCANRLKMQQNTNLKEYFKKFPASLKKVHSTVGAIYNDTSIGVTYKVQTISWNTYQNNIPLDEIDKYFRMGQVDYTDTNIRKLLSLYDYLKYSELKASDL